MKYHVVQIKGLVDLAETATANHVQNLISITLADLREPRKEKLEMSSGSQSLRLVLIQN